MIVTQDLFNNRQTQTNVDKPNDVDDTYDDHFSIVYDCIPTLDLNSEDTLETKRLIRSLKIIENNLKVFRADELTKYIHLLVKIFVAVSIHKIKYVRLLGEVTLLILDKTIDISDKIYTDEQIDIDEIDFICTRLILLENATVEQMHVYTNSIIDCFRKEIVHAEISSSMQDISYQPNQKMALDLAYFKSLVSYLEEKFPYWKKRTERTLPLAFSLNRVLSDRVQSEQLEAAVYMHDVGLSFLDENLIFKEGKFSEKERNQMKEHVQIVSYLLNCMPGWSEAALIVEQHHEYWDGSGYPRGLKQNDICLGAQIIAIIDAYESMTHSRPGRQHTRSILRAASELNKRAGIQFSPRLIPLFNTLINTD